MVLKWIKWIKFESSKNIIIFLIENIKKHTHTHISVLLASHIFNFLNWYSGFLVSILKIIFKSLDYNFT